MANTKISALTSVTALAAADTFPVVQSGVTKKAAVSDLFSFAPPGFKNLLHNGNFSVNQRAVGSHAYTVSSNYEINVDRWMNTTTNSVNGEVVAGTSPIRYNYRIVSNNASGTFFLGQRIESINIGHLAGSTVTLQLKVSATTLTSLTYTVSVPSSFNADVWGTFASPLKTTVVTGTIPLTTSLTRNTVTFTVPNNAIYGLEVMFSATGMTNGSTFTIADVQLEAGSAATAFETRPYQTELALCQRYLNGFTSSIYPYAPPSTGPFAIGSGYSTSATNTLIFVPFSVPLRRRPSSITIPSSYSFFALYNGSAVTGVPTSFAWSNTSGSQVGVISVTTTAGSPTIAAAQPAYLVYNYTSTHRPVLFTGAEMLD